MISSVSPAARYELNPCRQVQLIGDHQCLPNWRRTPHIHTQMDTNYNCAAFMHAVWITRQWDADGINQGCEMSVINTAAGSMITARMLCTRVLDQPICSISCCLLTSLCSIAAGKPIRYQNQARAWLQSLSPSPLMLRDSEASCIFMSYHYKQICKKPSRETMLFVLKFFL